MDFLAFEHRETYSYLDRVTKNMTDEDCERAERTSFDKHLKRGATTVMNNLDRTLKHFKDVLKAHELKLKTVEVLKVM